MHRQSPTEVSDGSVPPSKHPRGICAWAVAHGATPHQKKAYYAGIMLDALKGLLCSTKLCRHKIRSLLGGGHKQPCMPRERSQGRASPVRPTKISTLRPRWSHFECLRFGPVWDGLWVSLTSTSPQAKWTAGLKADSDGTVRLCSTIHANYHDYAKQDRKQASTEFQLQLQGLHLCVGQLKTTAQLYINTLTWTVCVHPSQMWLSMTP